MQRLKKGTELFCLLWALMSVIHGCAIGGSHRAKVIERSKESPPVWSGWKPFEFREREGRLTFVASVSNLEEVAEAIPKVQQYSVNSFFEKLGENVRTTVSRLTADKVFLTQKQWTSLGFEVDRVLVSGRAELKIVDIYYEKAEPPHGSSTDRTDRVTVYVLCELPLGSLGASMKSLANKLLVKQDQDFRDVGRLLQESLE